MKILFKESDIEEDFEYSPEITINQVREWAAPKMGCKATNLFVRKRGYPNRLSVEKSFEELSICPEGSLTVAKAERNNTLNAAKYAKKIFRKEKNKFQARYFQIHE